MGECAAGGDARTAEELQRKVSALLPLFVSFLFFFFPMFIWSIPRFKKKPKKIPNYREKKINANPHYRLGASFPIDSSCPPAPVRVWAAGGDERVGTRHRE